MAYSRTGDRNGRSLHAALASTETAKNAQKPAPILLLSEGACGLNPVMGCYTMPLPVMFLCLLLNAWGSSQDRHPQYCYKPLGPSFDADGDLLLGAFFPLYYMKPEAARIRLSFLTQPKDEVAADR